MPIPSPFHPNTSKCCHSLKWTDWAGYYSVCAYQVPNDSEYYAIRHAAGLIDITPLFKYDIRGAQAGDFLATIMSRDVSNLVPSQVAYCCWCDDDGKVLQKAKVVCR